MQHAPSKTDSPSFLIQFLLAIFCALAVLHWWTHQVVFDDSFISYRYARQFVLGHGLVYNTGDYIEGYTNFLWVWLAVAALSIGCEPLIASRIVGVGSLVALVILTARIFKAELVSDRASLPFISCALILLIFPEGFAAIAGSGLETIFVSFLALLYGYLEFTAREAAPRSSILTQGVAIALILTRLDAAIFIVAGSCVVMGKSFLQGPCAQASCQERVVFATSQLLRRMALVFLGGTLFFIWKLWIYGTVLPMSFYAKGAYLFSWQQGVQYAWGFLRSYPHCFVLAGAFLAAPFMVPAVSRPFIAYLWFSVLLYTTYVVKVGGDFMHYRFMLEIYPLFLVAALLGLVWLCKRRLQLATLVIAALCPVVWLTQPKLELTYGMQSLKEMDRYAVEGKIVASLLKEILPSNTIIATTLAGTMSYYTDFEVVDIWGLNDAHIAHQDLNSIKYRGHAKLASEEYLVARGVNLSFGHPDIVPCDRKSDLKEDYISIRIDTSRCIRARYLNQNSALTKLFCTMPERFAAHGVLCSGAALLPNTS